jgi:hypothetical protein
MHVGSDPSSRARNVTLLALLALFVAIAAMGSGCAFKQWGTASAQVIGGARVQIASTRVIGLYPGAQRRLLLVLGNGDARRSAFVGRILVSVVSTTKTGCAPTAQNLRVNPYVGPQLTIPPHSTRRLMLDVTMPNTVSNACQQAIFNLRYTAQFWTGPVRR